MKLRILSVLALLGSLTAQEPAIVSTPVDLSKTGFQLTGTPDSLSVSIDDSVYGATPVTVTNLSEGEHTIIFTKKGFYGKKVTVVAIKDSIVPVSAELRSPASLTVITTPDSAILFINRKKLDKTPYTANPLRPESYSLMLLKAGYNQLDTTVTLESGAIDTLRLSMVPQATTSVSQEITPKQVAIDSVKSPTQKPIGEQSKLERRDSNPSTKKRFTIIASAIFAAFLSILFISEFSDKNS